MHLATADEKKNRPAFHKTPAGRIVPAKKRITNGSAPNGADKLPDTSGKTGSGQVAVAALQNATHVAGQGGAGASAPSAKAACPSHTVRAGETLFSIAAKRLGDGKHWTRIRDANGNLDPARLKPGMQLALPCSTRASAKIAGATAIRPTGIDAKGGKGIARRTSAPSTGKSAAATASPKPQPVWTARKGETFRTVIERWAKRAGHTVIIDTSDAWTIHVAVELRGDFRTAIGKLVRGLSHDGVAPPVRIYPNKVVRVGL